MFVAMEKFISGLIKTFDKHPLSTTDGDTWYPQSCRFLNFKHHLHSSFEKNIIEKTMQYQGQDGVIDHYFPCIRRNVN
jgi:putative transposase